MSHSYYQYKTILFEMSMKKDVPLPAFPRYPSNAHKTQQARISLYYSDEGVRKAYYLGQFDTPLSHAIYSVVQLWYNTHNGKILDRKAAELEASAIINSDNFGPEGHVDSVKRSLVSPIVYRSVVGISAAIVLFWAGVLVGRRTTSSIDPPDQIETGRPVLENDLKIFRVSLIMTSHQSSVVLRGH